MKAITKYQADDGAEFRTEAECATYEALCAEVATVVQRLPATPKDDGCKFANGGGYIQHNRETFLSVRESLLRIANRIMPHKWFDQSIADTSVDSGWAGRLIDEMPRPLSRGWSRIACTDRNTFREYGQPYYAMNPDKAEQFEVTP